VGSFLLSHNAVALAASSASERAGLAGSGCELDTQVCARHTVAIQSLLQRHILISHQYYGMRVCLALPLPALARSLFSAESLFLHASERERERKRDAARDACLGLTPTILHAHSHGALSFLFVLFAPLRPPPPPPTKRQCQFWSSCKIAQPVF